MKTGPLIATPPPSACIEERNPAFSAASLVAKGLYPFPLKDHDQHDPQSFKRPRFDGWQQQAENATEADLAEWDHQGYNLGLHLGPSDLVVLDTDTPEAEAWAQEHLPHTPWSQKTAQGRHRFYRLPEGMPAPKNNKPIPGMDRKTKGGYVLAPGSWHHKAAVRYEPQGDWSVPIDQLPTYDPTWFPQKARDLPTKKAPTVPQGDREAVLQAASAFLEQRPAAISGEDGHTTAFTAALAVAINFALSEEELFVLLRDHYNERCDPPWSEAELRHKAKDAHAAALESPDCGCLVPGAVDADGVETPEGAIARLAQLTTLNYALCRVKEAELVGIRVTDLDSEVERVRALTKGKQEAAGRPAMFKEIEPWSEPVDLADLLDEIKATFHRHIVLDSFAASAASLWVVFTWFIDWVQVAPLLAISSPEKRCGKTQTLDVVGRLSFRPLVASNISSSAVFRIIEGHHPSLMIDEADSFLHDNEEMRGVLNSGHTRQSAYVIRCEGDDHVPMQFSTWCGKAIALIGKLPGTLADRSINVALRRKKPSEKVQRLRHADPETFTHLASKLARFAADHGESIAASRPALPEALNDRAQDNWEPLLALADHAGGAWPSRAREAALGLSGIEHDPASTPIELLADIKAVFAGKRVERLSSDELMSALISDPTRPWVSYEFGRAITPRQVGKLLVEFGISPKSTRFGAAVQRGYHLADFKDAFDRYLTDVAAPSATRYTSATPGTAPTLDCNGVADPAPPSGGGIHLLPAAGDGLTKKKRKYV